MSGLEGDRFSIQYPGGLRVSGHRAGKGGLENLEWMFQAAHHDKELPGRSRCADVFGEVGECEHVILDEEQTCRAASTPA